MTKFSHASSSSQAAASGLARAIRAVLTHPLASTVKRVARNAVWAVKGRRVVNPPLRAPARSVLFVCLGNICRSPFAEHIATRRIAEAGLEVRCASAGITAKQGGAVPLVGQAVAATTYGIDLAAHRPQRLTEGMVEAHDLVVVMEAGQFSQLREIYPQAAHRIVLLSLFDPEPASAFERFHIADPFGQSRAVFAASFARIERAVSLLVAQVVSGAS